MAEQNPQANCAASLGRIPRLLVSHCRKRRI
nr:MAG TPA: hypothetical protein [Caudoviricetes sp.]